MHPTVDQEDGVRGDRALASLLHRSRVDWEVLDDRYRPLLRLVEGLLGVVPNCDQYLEIWPPAFRTYNVMVPNLLNLPVPVLGVSGPPPGVVGLAMYVASRTAGCSYCSAHSCSFAMRRGASPEAVAGALLPDRATFTRGELATIAVARSLARIPCELTAAEKAELVEVFGERRSEWIVLSVAMMGFLNKFMDAIGVELEQDLVDEVAETLGSGWAPGRAGADLDPSAASRPAPPADGLRSRLRLLPLLPGAIRYDRAAQRGMPRRAGEVGAHLLDRVGHAFPGLADLRSDRARRAIATMLCENLDPTTSVVGIDVKVVAGAIYATLVEDVALAADVDALARRAGVAGERLAAAAAFARGEHPTGTVPGDTEPVGAACALARAASSSPACVDAGVVDACERAGLTPPAIVEVVTWLAVLQLLHRLAAYTAV